MDLPSKVLNTAVHCRYALHRSKSNAACRMSSWQTALPVKLGRSSHTAAKYQMLCSKLWRIHPIANCCSEIQCHWIVMKSLHWNTVPGAAAPPSPSLFLALPGVYVHWVRTTIIGRVLIRQGNICTIYILTYCWNALFMFRSCWEDIITYSIIPIIM